MDTSSIGAETTGPTAASSAGVWYAVFPECVVPYILKGFTNSVAYGLWFPAICDLGQEDVGPVAM